VWQPAAFGRLGPDCMGIEPCLEGASPPPSVVPGAWRASPMSGRSVSPRDRSTMHQNYGKARRTSAQPWPWRATGEVSASIMLAGAEGLKPTRIPHVFLGCCDKPRAVAVPGRRSGNVICHVVVIEWAISKVVRPTVRYRDKLRHPLTGPGARAGDRVGALVVGLPSCGTASTAAQVGMLVFGQGGGRSAPCFWPGGEMWSRVMALWPQSPVFRDLAVRASAPRDASRPAWLVYWGCIPRLEDRRFFNAASGQVPEGRHVPDG